MRYFLFFAILVSSSCHLINNESKDSKLIASAYGKNLYISDLNIPNNFNREDSIRFITSGVDNWVLNQIYLQNIDKEIKDDPKIAGLVSDYKTSLLISEFERKWLSENQNQNISALEVNNFYIKHQKDYLLRETALKFLFIKTDTLNALKYDRLKKAWQDEDMDILQRIADEEELKNLLYKDQWYYKSDIITLLPKEILKKISFKKDNSDIYSLGEYEYFVKVSETLKVNDPTPVSLVSESIIQKILYNKSVKALDRMKKELYQKHIKSKDIQIF